MFTGIVEELGEVVEVETRADDARLVVRGPQVVSDAALGSSIAVNGVCLTVTAIEGDTFAADVMGETLSRSGLGKLGAGAAVNLERPLRASDRLGGHVVQGHVDATARVLSRTPGARWDVVRVALPEALARYVVEKGSIALDGVSLTVSAVCSADDQRPWFEVSLIPETLARTTLGQRAPGDCVNVEVDVLAKTVERLLQHQAGGARLTRTEESQ